MNGTWTGLFCHLHGTRNSSSLTQGVLFISYNQGTNFIFSTSQKPFGDSAVGDPPCLHMSWRGSTGGCVLREVTQCFQPGWLISSVTFQGCTNVYSYPPNSWPKAGESWRWPQGCPICLIRWLKWPQVKGWGICRFLLRGKSMVPSWQSPRMLEGTISPRRFMVAPCRLLPCVVLSAELVWQRRVAGVCFHLLCVWPAKSTSPWG